jgi:hypothetical protein
MAGTTPGMTLTIPKPSGTRPSTYTVCNGPLLDAEEVTTMAEAKRQIEERFIAPGFTIFVEVVGGRVDVPWLHKVELAPVDGGWELVGGPSSPMYPDE